MSNDNEVTGPPEAKDPTWVCSDGRRILVTDMTDSHVHNARNWALRRSRYYDGWALNASRYAADAPDGASMAAEESSEQYMKLAQALREWADYFSRVLKDREKLRGGEDAQ